ncbi:hypothetical protein K9N08_00725 [Candidatus Gracilibacteria bacterium]|nr:hypothetical protein [Candidatus Gracilibacteria bacterium]MCF7856067.1 hypothetical protein [Candidatus Gracilibacteria bacterium]MCF7896378.1 hypothetical protein [Candidatus Gracilibacteria bacterium]
MKRFLTLAIFIAIAVCYVGGNGSAFAGNSPDQIFAALTNGSRSNPDKFLEKSNAGDLNPAAFGKFAGSSGKQKTVLELRKVGEKIGLFYGFQGSKRSGGSWRGSWVAKDNTLDTKSLRLTYDPIEDTWEVKFKKWSDTHTLKRATGMEAASK